MEDHFTPPARGADVSSDQNAGDFPEFDECAVDFFEVFGDEALPDLEEDIPSANLSDLAKNDPLVQAPPSLQSAEKIEEPAAAETNSINHDAVRPDADEPVHRSGEQKLDISEPDAGELDTRGSEPEVGGLNSGRSESGEPEPGNPDSDHNRADSVYEGKSPCEVVENEIDPSHIDDSFCKRQTRQHAGSKRGLTSWIDNDESGDFDPKQTEQNAKRKRPRTIFPKPRNPAQTARPQQPDPQLRVCLNVGAAVLLDLKPLTETPEAPPGYNLRDRERSPVSDSDDDISWRPQARGCRPCLKLGINCILIEDEYHWPCDACHLTGEFCELIVPPMRHQPCNDCKRRKIKCSYGYTRNHTGSCQQCIEDNIRCQAGPAKEFIRRRVRYPETGEEPLPPPVSEKKRGKHRAPDDCRECMRTETCCEYQLDEPSGCCRACKFAGLPCTTKDAPPRPPVRQRADTAAPVNNNPDSASNQPRMEHEPFEQLPTSPRVEKVSYVMKHIETAFYHPVILNCEFASSGPQICTFCSDPTMPFIGSGTRTAQVFDYHDYRPLVENKNDPATSGPTALCVICTSGMLDIFQCQKHVKKPILGANPKESDHLKAFKDIFSEDFKGSAEHCSLCLRLASFKCSTPTFDIRNKPQLGCGLKLCIKCASRLEGLYDGSVQDMLAAQDDDGGEDLFSRRADAEFLRKDGVLARHNAQLCD